MLARLPAAAAPPEADDVVFALVLHLRRVGQSYAAALCQHVEAVCRGLLPQRQVGKWLALPPLVGPAREQLIQGARLKHIARQNVCACKCGGAKR